MRTTLLSLAVSCLLASVASVAEAHIEMLEPTPRYTLAESGDNKACPCGLGNSNRTCGDPNDRSDPDRNAGRVTEVAAGSTIRLRWDEYIGHSGRFRVAIDFDGADLTDFNSNILVDIPDPSGSMGNSGQGSIWEVDVPIPNMTCDNCTLQLIQMMDGNTTDPVADPVGRSTYYTCADIRIVPGDQLPGADAGADQGGSDAGTGGGGASGSGCQTGGSASLLAGLGIMLALGLAGRRRRALARR